MIQKKTNTDLEMDLSRDANGVYMRQLQKKLLDSRTVLNTQTRQTTHIIRAYDTAIKLLPELWRFTQRR